MSKDRLAPHRLGNFQRVSQLELSSDLHKKLEGHLNSAQVRSCIAVFMCSADKCVMSCCMRAPQQMVGKSKCNGCIHDRTKDTKKIQLKYSPETRCEVASVMRYNEAAALRSLPI